MTTAVFCREAIEDRLCDKSYRMRLHRIMARYFGNMLEDKVREETGALPQPLVLPAIATAAVSSNMTVGPIWSPLVRPNRRRCVEAVHHMLKAEMFIEAKKELCSWEAVCARARCGRTELFQMVNQLVFLGNASANASGNVSPMQRKIVEHYKRWLLSDAYTIMKSPVAYIPITATRQPLSSTVRNEIRRHFASKSLPAQYWNSCNDKWWRGRVLGGISDFGAILNIMQGEMLESHSLVNYSRALLSLHRFQL